LALPAVGAEPAATSIAASGAATVRWGATAPLVVRVSGTTGTPTGMVRVVSGDRLVASGQLVDGRVRLAVGTTALGVGTHDLQVRYDGSAGHVASTTTTTLRVVKVGSTTTVRVVRTIARVRVVTDPEGQVPDRVRAALLRRGKVVRSRWLDLSDAGRARWRVSGRPGTYVVRVVTPGSATLDRSTDSARVRLR